MTRHVCIIGIDGSGKSTVAQSLPALVAAESGHTVVAAGARFQVVAPEQDLLTGELALRGRPGSLRLAGWFRALAKRFAKVRWLYPIFKLLHMLFQDRTARALAERYAATLVLSEGNTLLCTVGRAMNYLAPASERDGQTRAAGALYLSAILRYLREGGVAPRGPLSTLWLRLGRVACRALRAVGLDPLWLPDQVIFLDVPIAEALARISARGGPPDRHENASDMSQARRGYLAGFQALSRQDLAWELTVLETGAQTLPETLRGVHAALRLSRAPEQREAEQTLGTTERTRTWRRVLARVADPRYLGYQLRYLRQDAWREPAFLFSAGGRQLLAEGYSANTMAAIYAQDGAKPGLPERIFLGYPLHRAVYDRLHILVPELAWLIQRELQRRGRVRIFTAPSGHAEDLFRALEALPSAAVRSRIEVVAADLDPSGTIERKVTGRARALGVRLHFVRCDLTSPEGRVRLASHGAFDLALFVGLSAWLPKPAMRAHLQWLASVLPAHATLVTDCFSVAPYAVAGALAGYQANYFSPEAYAAFVADCGFVASGRRARSGRDRINHVQLFSPDASRAASSSNARSAS